MAENIQVLIDKINREGVQKAEEKAEEITLQAKLEAERIIGEAKLQARQIEALTEEETAKIQKREKALLAQAGRDLLLELKEKINDLLLNLIKRDVSASLTPENMAKILGNIIQGACGHEKTEITIALNKNDLSILENNFLAKLKEEAKKEIILKSSEALSGGFTISFDTGKSQFDFSDKALAEYITTFLKPKLKEILKT